MRTCLMLISALLSGGAYAATESAQSKPEAGEPELGELASDLQEWQECWQWFASWQARVLACEKHNVSRGATIELLTIAVEAAAKQSKRMKRRLHQLAVSTRRGKHDGKIRSDELRRVLNMAACAYQEGERGDFPVC